jgi:tyrosine-protein kinase Etk/Wzc
MYKNVPLPEREERLGSNSVDDPTPAPQGSQEVSVLDILIVVAERKRTVLLITLAFALIAAIVSLVLPSRYTASASLLPPQQNSSVSSALAAQLGSLGGMASLAGGSFGLRNPNEIFVAMLRSQTVEEAMINRFGLQQEYHKRYLSDACKAFENHSSVVGSGKDTLIRISFEDGDPKRAAEIANAYVEEFRKLSEHLAITEASQRRLFFEQQLLTAKDNLTTAEQALKETQQSTGLIQLDAQARALIESAATLRAQIDAKEVQMQALRTFATTENAQYLQEEQELNTLRGQLARLGGSEGSADAGLIVPKGKVPEAGLEYVRKLRDVKYYETIFEILARQFEFAKLDEARQGPVIQVVDNAKPPDRRSFPKRTLIVLGATLLGLLTGLFAVLIQAGYESKKAETETYRKLSALRQALSFRRNASSSTLEH